MIRAAPGETGAARFPASRQGPYRFLMLIVIALVVFHVMMIAAAPLGLFEFLPTFVCLSALFPMPLHRNPKLFFRLVNTPVTPAIVIVGLRRE